ncbi:hypothetical protein PanWU01x14_231610, partial [Parasponia andersonii]
SIWNRRNNKLFNGNVIDTLELVNQALSYFIEFQTSTLRTKMDYSAHLAPSAIHQSYVCTDALNQARSICVDV